MKPPLKAVVTAVLLVLVVSVITTMPRYSDVIAQLWGLNQLQFFEFKRKLKARLVPSIDKRFAFTTSDSLVPEPSASTPAGYYDRSLSVELRSREADASIRYTTDGSTPTLRSRRYNGPIEIDETTVLRFRAYGSGHLPSATVTHTYLINTDYTLPVVSVVADPVVLWNRYSGIHANPERRGRKWERIASVEYLAREEGSVGFEARLRVHGGGWARRHEKKGFRLTYATAEVQGSEIDNVLTEASPDSERVVLLRPAFITYTARLGGEVFDALYTEIGGMIAKSIPVLLLINGEMWGHYRVYERINGEFLRRRFGEGDYALIKNQRKGPNALAGGDSAWVATVDYFERHRLTSEDEYLRAAEIIDVEGTVDYWLLNIYVGNYDWPDNNSHLFKRLDTPESQWRWLGWDSDYAFRPGVVGKNTLAWATRDEPRSDLIVNPGPWWQDKETGFFETLIIRKLLDSEEFSEYFVIRFCDLLNTTLRAEHIQTRLDSIIAVRAADLEIEFERWPRAFDRYHGGIATIQEFIEKRPDIILGFFRERFDLGDLHTIGLAIEPPGAGEIQINTTAPGEYPWTGRYFEDLPVSLSAKPSAGFEFTGWTDPSLGNSPQVRVRLERDTRIQARFQRVRGATP